MIIARHLSDQMISHARESAPFECCGLIGCRGLEAVEIYQARNVADAPTLSYAVDGTDQMAFMGEMERAGLRLGGIYHSHVSAPAFPSYADIAMAAYPGVVYVIVSLAGEEPVLRGYEIIAGMVAEVELETGDSRAHAPPPA